MVDCVVYVEEPDGYEHEVIKETSYNLKSETNDSLSVDVNEIKEIIKYLKTKLRKAKLSGLL